MISTATILESMARDISQKGGMSIDYKFYENKIQKYKPTYDGMMDDFYDSIYGEYSNRISKEKFVEKLSEEGWKYFNMRNLNELFALKYEEHGTIIAVPYQFLMPQFDQEEHDASASEFPDRGDASDNEISLP